MPSKTRKKSFHKKSSVTICSRCTGIILGVLIGLIFSFIVQFKNFYLMALLLIPMAVDGMVQKHTSYLSNNSKRVVTGLIFGFAYMYIFMMLDRMFW